ncbi:MAG: energy transducer TonB [Gammaproteobacteria bacterium]|nr:energy transducer TonB [Gammaproteobacteria bacterium]
MELRVRSDRPEDRLATAIFIAALVHGLIILGVKFSAPAANENPLPTLEVLLVPEGPPEADNPKASYIAQRSQHGSGTARDRKRTSLPEASASLLENQGQPGGDSLTPDASTETVGGTQLLSSRSTEAHRTTSGAETQQATAAAVPMEAKPLQQIGANATAADASLHLRGDPSTDDRLLADTRESIIASYLDGWKRRIERVGTLNFPNEACRRGLSGNPVLEVAIRADGGLEQVVVRRSSGHRELDNAALGIVRLASPFDPFPSAMRERYPVLRFAYEWQFLKGQVEEGAVFADRP